MYKVYILQSIKDGKYYIGCTRNLERRFLEHNRGQTKSTKNRRPFRLVYVEFFKDKHLASKREREIKNYKGGNKFKDLVGRTSH